LHHQNRVPRYRRHGLHGRAEFPQEFPGLSKLFDLTRADRDLALIRRHEGIRNRAFNVRPRGGTKRESPCLSVVRNRVSFSRHDSRWKRPAASYPRQRQTGRKAGAQSQGPGGESRPEAWLPKGYRLPGTSMSGGRKRTGPLRLRLKTAIRKVATTDRNTSSANHMRKRHVVSTSFGSRRVHCRSASIQAVGVVSRESHQVFFRLVLV
jgi:hypothetical protein